MTDESVYNATRPLEEERHCNHKHYIEHEQLYIRIDKSSRDSGDTFIKTKQRIILMDLPTVILVKK